MAEVIRPPKMPKMGRRWIDREIMIDGKKIKLKRLQPLGNSLALLLPKVWIELSCEEDAEGKYWVEVEADAKRITITGYKG